MGRTRDSRGFFGKAVFGSILVFGAVPVAYLIRLLYARGLSVEEYGLFYAMIAFFMLLSIFANLGTKQALGYLIPKHEGTREANRIASASGVLIVVATIIIASTIFLVAPWLEQLFFQVEGAALLMQIMTGYFVTHQLVLIPGGLFLGLRAVWAYAGRELYRLVLALFFSILALILFELTIVAAAIAWVVSQALVTIGYFIALRITAPHIKYEKPDAKAYKDLLSYGIPTIFVAGAAVIMSKIDTVMITAFRAIGEVAAYNVAYPTAQLLVALASPLVLVILPEVSALFHKHRLSEAQSLTKTITRIMTAVTILGVVLLTTLATPVLGVLFGAEFTGASSALVILAFGLAANGLAGILLQVLGAIGEVKRRAVLMNIAVGLNVVLNLILIYLYGYIGAAIATSITYVFLLALSVWELKRHGFETFSADSIWRLGIPALIAAPVTFVLGTLTIILPLPWFIPQLLPTVVLAAGVGALVYGLIALATKGIRIDDMTMLWNEMKAILPFRNA